MNAPVTIKGWCPGALRPMMSGDGLLVRVRIREATLSPGDAVALADLSLRFGNGAIDLTRRANLQLRGVSQTQWLSLTEALYARGLIGPEEVAGQAVNIVSSPLSGLDSGMAFDPRPVAHRIEAGLLADTAFRALPSKFGFAIDGGGVLPLGYTDADLSIAAAHDGAGVVVRLAGSSDDVPVALRDAADAGLGLARAFLALRGTERRMRSLVERIGAVAIFAAADLATANFAALRTDGLSEKTGHGMSLGVHRCGDTHILGVAAPFGAWAACDFAAVAAFAASDIGATLRVTPRRALLIAGLSRDNAAHALEALASRALIVTADDPRLSIAACVGAPSCGSASVATRALAEALAPAVTPSEAIVLHVSGCAKGCAHSHAAPVTLTGRGGGYDLVVDGRPDATPLRVGLDFNEAKTETSKMLSPDMRLS